ncbi:MAG: phenylacetic acid degradation bifunctional protein PaaZ [Gammaproteobacteria bacterium]|nr:phenylacetic acid degradation bifunctional protein PaaZ [Gammaproteobacteria bacterium]
MKVSSYVAGHWHQASDDGVQVFNAINGDLVGCVSTTGIDFQAVLNHGRLVGGSALRKMTFHERGNMLKNLAKYLLERKAEFYRVSAFTGATKLDSWIDIEGGVQTLFTYSGLVRREFANETFALEGKSEPLSKNGSFVGRHLLVPKEGVAVHINAFNFPCWGMLEKIAPSLAAGMPVVVKPATASGYLTEVMVKTMIESGLLPEGALQLISGSVGNLLDLLDEQDVVTFTGSASTGQHLRSHPNIIAKSIPFTMEADSLNYSILGEAAVPGTAEFDLFIKGVVTEMTVKAGQKCTAIRRALVPASQMDAVGDALTARLAKITLGDPALDGVRMGPLVGRDQLADVWSQVHTLMQSAGVVCGGREDFALHSGDRDKGAFFPATVLRCDEPFKTDLPHQVEAFGPVTTMMPYADLDEAIALAKLGGGSLVGSIVTADSQEATKMVLGTACWHGRLLVLNDECAQESTGHGSPLPTLVHGGPGRAGGGEELGGIRAVKHYMQRTAVQGSPTMLTDITKEFHPGAKQVKTDVHPFRKYFEDLQIGETLITHRRTVTEADIVNFGCLSGDHFYAHFDEQAAKDSLFGKRVAHGYFVISAAAGMFVEPSPGPVLANYGLENLRFIEPVGIGDTIQVRLTCKQKIYKDKRPDDFAPTGVVEWDVEVYNQHNETVALYSIMTLVERRQD